MPRAELAPDRVLDYDVEGRGEPVVLLCGLGMNRSVWYDVVEALTPRHRVLTCDLRGSTGVRPEGDFTIADLADDLVRLLDHLDTGPVHLVGHSQGGFVALEAVLARPDLVRSLVLGASASYTDEYGRRVLENWRGTLLSRGQKEFYKNLFLWQYSPDYFNDRTRELDVMGKWLSRAPMDVDTYLAHNHACTTHETRERLGAVTAPTLLLGGAEDRVMGLRHNRLLKQLIPHARLVTLDRLAHDLFVESPDRTLPLVEEFLGGPACEAGAGPRAAAGAGSPPERLAGAGGGAP